MVDAAVAENPRPKFQYSLRTLLLAFPVVAWCIVTGVHGTVLGASIIAVVYFLKRRLFTPAFCVIVGMLSLTGAGLGTSVEFRLDTGDQRYLLWGIPVKCYSLDAEQRTSLLKLNDPELPRQWVWCALQERNCTNNPDLMVSSFYRDAAAWLEVDPEIAKLIMRDLAKYLKTTHGKGGLPDCCAMIWCDVVDHDNEGRPHVIAGWRNNIAVQNYLQARGYTIQ